LKNVLEILTDIRPESDFSGSNDYINEGLLDSFDVVMLVNELDKNYDISIEGVDILPDNFRSAAAIETLLQKYGV
jgi:acyl carrier protein